MAAVSPLIRATGLSKRYGVRRVLRDVSLTLGPGEAVVIVGPNGAGKSTLLRILATLVRPSAGTVWYFDTPGLPLAQIRRRLGFVGHQTLLYEDLTVAENLRLYAGLYALDNVAARIARVVELLGIAHLVHERVRTLSRGQQQRAGLARALLHDPTILLFDEPDTGLDQQGRQLLHALIAEHCQRGGAVLLTTHAVDFATTVATRQFQLCDGQLWPLPEGQAASPIPAPVGGDHVRP
ncbi:heme ABC exporter ATP-binding protein CcmA [Thermorudis peleae]|uniref:heme ABC exporter ATP-binding protein CcmA n=1 Tax=Thermorudis peleae TaxID=1382356 RepID=UPI0018CDC6CD|nr:heme ABC exporter ATP-binding protein CcmA [Thermorudis peleae]